MSKPANGLRRGRTLKVAVLVACVGTVILLSGSVGKTGGEREARQDGPPAASPVATSAAAMTGAGVTVRTATQPGAEPQEPQYGVRGVYDRDFSATGFDDQAAIGFNYIDSGPYKDQLDALAARGLKGFIWLGGYSNATCHFNES